MIAATGTRGVADRPADDGRGGLRLAAWGSDATSGHGHTTVIRIPTFIDIIPYPSHSTDRARFHLLPTRDHLR